MGTEHPPFLNVLLRTGPRPATEASQHESRHYSETFSKEVALWLRAHLEGDPRLARVLTPEARVRTVYGTKSLDIAGLDARDYLALDISIKTFNFKDRQTGNYRHNYTGRFYELLGEELDIRRSYRWATLVAMIFLPEDSCFDSDPSSFGHAVRQFSKIAMSPEDAAGAAYFEHVFVAVHDTVGRLFLFDATQRPPRTGTPFVEQQLSIQTVVERVMKTVGERSARIAESPVPVTRRFGYT